MLSRQEFQTKMSENIRQEAHSSLMSILNPMHVLHRSLQNIEGEVFEKDPSCRNPNSPETPSEIHSAGSIRERPGPESFSQKAPNHMCIDYNVTSSGLCAPPRNNVFILRCPADLLGSSFGTSTKFSVPHTG
jgi:hypothetical protein